MLKENQAAPDFTLPEMDGAEKHFYDDPRAAIFVFYKFNCPTCQLALPFIQKIFDAYGDAYNFVSIAQDGPEKTRSFRETFGISLPALLDMTPYPVSTSYQLQTVPSILFVNPDRIIRFAGEGFVKQELLNLADVLAEQTGRPQIDLFGDTPVPEIKPG